MGTVHMIHSCGGRIGVGTDTAPGDVDGLIASLVDDPRGHLALHFHGGLVSKEAGRAIAQRLSPLYSESTMPVFYVWESGFFETLRNNLRELAVEPVFKQLVRKLLEYALERLGGVNGSRSIAPGSVDPRAVRQTVERHWAAPAVSTVPYRNFDPMASRIKARSAATQIDLDEMRANLESDHELAYALATLPDLLPNTRSALAPAGAPEHRSAFSEAISDRVSEHPGSRGLICWIKVAWLVKNILSNVLIRYGQGRDHGLYATVVEEILRECKLAGSSINEWGKALQWNRMKQDTLDAFNDGNDQYAGTALLSRLATLLRTGAGPKRITLIGHSTGAIYIAHWLAAADRLLPGGIRFDVVLLAPAITYESFDQTLQKHGQRIRHFRMFAMRDPLEREDQVWGGDSELEDGGDWRRLVYPSSLLYLVSGVLESSTGPDGTLKDAPDMPLLGLERHYARSDVYPAQDFPEVARVRTWLDAEPGRMVWAKSEGQLAGLNSLSADHGAFDDDDQTLQSISAVLRSW